MLTSTNPIGFRLGFGADVCVCARDSTGVGRAAHVEELNSFLEF